MHSSSNLIQTLLKYDLIDEFRLWIFPVTIGKGKRLFGEGTQPAHLKLIDSKTSTTGVIIATYEPAGKLKAGSFALDDPSPESKEEANRIFNALSAGGMIEMPISDQLWGDYYGSFEDKFEVQ